jgi:tetratricopeptide (TPR) repeat protein
LAGDVGGEQLAGEFAFDPEALEQLFTDLAPSARPAPAEVSADDPLALARDYVAKGLLELATAELGRARARGADPGRVATLMGDIFARRGLHGEALERFRDARAALPDDGDALLGEIRSLAALDRGAEAVELAARLERLRPRDPEALVACARAHLAVDDERSALRLVRHALEVAPGRPELYQLQATIASRMGDTDAALEACQLALRIDAGLVQVWRELGGLEETRENWTAARAAYERALQLLPTYSPAQLSLGDLLRRTESPRVAVSFLVPVLETDPYDFDALALLGRALLDDGRTGRALEAFDRVLRFVPDHLLALFHRAAALARVRQFRAAVEAWDRVIQLEPGGALAGEARSRARSARDLEHILADREA